jgi:hypothetical protein
MKRWFAAMVFTMAMSGAGMAQEPTLATSSMEAYQASIASMGEPLGPDGARELILRLMVLSAGPAPEGQEAAHRQAAMAAAMKDPQAFLDGLKPYEGMTAQQIMDATP